MKGRLKNGEYISDNKSLLAGSVVDIVDKLVDCRGRFYVCETPDGEVITVNSLNMEIVDHTPYIDWETRRYELAKSAMQGYCIALGLNDDSESYEDIAVGSVRAADALIKELKKKH